MDRNQASGTTLDTRTFAFLAEAMSFVAGGEWPAQPDLCRVTKEVGLLARELMHHRGGKRLVIRDYGVYVRALSVAAEVAKFEVLRGTEGADASRRARQGEWPLDPVVGVPEFFERVRDELARARAKYPGNVLVLAALTEELGELAEAVGDAEMLPPTSPGREGAELAVHEEAVQVAAMACRLATEGDSGFPYEPSRVWS